MWMILFLIVAIQSVQCCIPLGIGSGCDCQVNPGCGRCLPPIPPVQRTCAGCAFSNDVQPSFVNSAPYVAPNPSQIPTANNQYPQQPVAIPISEPISNSLGQTLNDHINQKDEELRTAIAEYNSKEHANFPFPGESSTQNSNRKEVSPPGVEPVQDEYSGLPSIYFTMRPNILNFTPTSTESTNSYSEDLLHSQKANSSVQTIETTESSISSTKEPTTRAYAFASGTYWAVLEERETENGDTRQRRIPYHAYEKEVCTGATLGRSIEKDMESVAVKCTMVGCAAVNVRPISDGTDQYEAIYLKNVNARRQIKASKAYTCLSIIDVPTFEHVYDKREKEIQREMQYDRTPKTISQPPRLRFVSIQPKGV